MVKTNTKKEKKGGYLSRSQAIRYLQVSLADFRRLCILKGIYPRELSGKAKEKIQKGSTKPVTAYYRKDIQYLLHEPLLQKFRDHKIFARKLTRALGRGDLTDAQRIDENRPRYTLDHVIKERYPTFLDALGDLDDALSMLFLFATMPATDHVSSRITQEAERLSTEWMAFVARNHLLRKVFVSIKGVYYQANVKGQDVLWVVPFKFPQSVPSDIDFRIMLTFLEFYTTLLHFVLYRLYTEQGLVYPPPLRSEDGIGGIGAYILDYRPSSDDLSASKSSSNRKARQISQDALDAAKKRDEEGASRNDEQDSGDEVDDIEENLDDFEADAGQGDTLAQPSAPRELLFSRFKFFVGREVPLDIVEFLILAFGGTLVSESRLDELDDPTSVKTDGITHQISDRPAISNRITGRIYIQPQWLMDSVNAGKLLPVGPYGLGEALPPHLSPWGDRGAYDPTAERSNATEDTENAEMEAGEAQDDASDDIQDAADDAEEDSADEDQKELQMESAGVRYSESRPARSASSSKAKSSSKKRKSEDEEKELRKMMMSNKQRKLYDKMQYSNSQKQVREDTLRKKRQKLEKLNNKAAK